MRNTLSTKRATKSPTVKVLRNGQITLPKEYRTALGIDEEQILEVGLTRSSITLKPKALVDEGEAFSPRGEKKIREALESYERGEGKSFDNIEDLMKDLNS